MRAVDGDGPRPLIVHTNGYDSTVCEMWLANVFAAVVRGYHCLLFDGPGQGRPLIEHGLRMRADWERVVSPVVDVAIKLPGVDPAKIVLVGWSFGVFLVLRAAAFEPRAAAVIADPGQWDQRDNVISALPLSDEQKAAFPNIDPKCLDPMVEWLRGPSADPMLRWKLLQRGLLVHGVDNLFDYFKELLAFELSGSSATSCVRSWSRWRMATPLPQAPQRSSTQWHPTRSSLCTSPMPRGAVGTAREWRACCITSGRSTGSTKC